MKKLNCWPGCVARIVDPGRDYHGKIIVCKDALPCQNCHGLLCEETFWTYEAPLIYTAIPFFIFGEVFVPMESINDAILRPIKDPPEEERDETLTWKPVPANPEKVTQ